MAKFEIHPYAEIFPIHGGESLDELAKDIKANGQLSPIALYADKVLDGRRRLAACEQAGVAPTFRQYLGRDPLGFVVSQNLHRRHMDESERAMVAARIANLKEGKPPNTPSKDGVLSNPPNTAHKCAVSQDSAADMMNVSKRSVQNAAKVQAKAEPEVVEAVDKGQASVRDAAAIADKPPAIQKAAVKAKVNGTAKTLKEGAAKAEANGDDHVPQLDGWGIPITAEAAEAFKAQDAFDEIVKDLQAVRKKWRALASSAGGVYLQGMSINKNDDWTHAGIETAIMNVKDAKPKYTVCPYAYSKNKGYVHGAKCNTCHGLGWTATIGKSFMPPQELIAAACAAHGVEAPPF